ncbi:PREDICTED: uncharacterized protein LOC109580393 [Amphimedon queenslandica]|uniref:EF-hand domain-containing protein n=1 Tax=Amphimedon queenslandica TaxID=400682 RepID=A0A1X7VG05_AMPQE|nr:PREDICTED: uncharacterized protein LOC109580393 [Amphimedon queenslandica]|eukprot:XP_019849038.1 PREDICTED: uncharacterized protein LOC109580393 [Amphimedon queenslandica]
MSQKRVSLYLKVPKKPVNLLHQLENSMLESMIEYKPIDPHTGSPLDESQGGASYQIRGTADVVDGELLIRFNARQAGLHTARIFANTKEVCRQVAFFVKSSGEVESVQLPMGGEQLLDSGLASGASTVRGAETKPTITSPPYSVPHSPTVIQSPQTISTAFKQSSRPPSFLYDESMGTTGNYAGELFGRPSGASFEQLLTAKQTNQVVPGIPHSSSRPDSMSEYLTPEALLQIHREAKKSVGISFGLKVKKRCDICTRKVKSIKCVEFWEMSFCDGCCKRNFMLKSALEHFLVPSIQECQVQVPLNKRETKFAKARKIMPNVNLRGLEPNEVRDAMVEFHKFDVEGDGWMDKAVLLPVLKACFTYSLPEQEIRALLTSKSLSSMIQTMGLNDREKVHHIEFLALLAFISRERQRIARDIRSSKKSKFTANDLDMAYAFQQQFPPVGGAIAAGQVAKPRKQVSIKPPQKQIGDLTRSYTDTPLSSYQPTAVKQKPYKGFISGIKTSPSVELTDDPPAQFDEEEEEEPEEEATPTVQEETTNAPMTGKKDKKAKMEELKITGDQRADGWMMY